MIESATKTWKRITPTEPPEGQPVRTRINDARGPRNEGILYRQGSLWFFEDGSMYVYYTPTEYVPYCPTCELEMTLHPNGNFYECPNHFTETRCGQTVPADAE